MREYTFIRKSLFSGEINERRITLDWDDHEAWQGGKLIQNAMPYLSADDREFLMTGITPEEWEKYFG